MLQSVEGSHKSAPLYARLAMTHNALSVCRNTNWFMLADVMPSWHKEGSFETQGTFVNKYS